MAKSDAQIRRCAVYTRKSSEEGLEQDFNSLNAQREACEAFIKSQAGEGWKLVPTAYDDGGISGGTMERPGLKALLADIAMGAIDTVVVYKVDRLTRALTDFAKMVEIFDRHGVSFVAVTQQFNTTTSMGRLTLNVLLSFAQFEREVTGERIRDKIAASKRKGIWMGGLPPLGYDVQDRKLVINKVEAETVRFIFESYLRLGCLTKLKAEMDRVGVVSKVRQPNFQKHVGGVPIQRGALYHLLTNPAYIGQVRHKGVCHEGQHEAILPKDLWDALQRKLEENRQGMRKRAGTPDQSPLVGKLFSETGERLVPTYSIKDGRRYRYYVSQSLLIRGSAPDRGWRLPAPRLEHIVVTALDRFLNDRCLLSSACHHADVPVGRFLELIQAVTSPADDRAMRHAQLHLLERVDLSPDGVKLMVSFASVHTDGPVLTYFVPLVVKRRGIELRLICGDETIRSRPDSALTKAIARAQTWFEELMAGTITAAGIAVREGLSAAYIGRIVRLAFLSPDIVKAIVSGQQPTMLTAEALINKLEIPSDWAEQKRCLGF